MVPTVNRGASLPGRDEHWVRGEDNTARYTLTFSRTDGLTDPSAPSAVSKFPGEATQQRRGRARAHTLGRREGRARDSATTGSKTVRGGDRLGARRGGREATG